jgi:hypothetical protein
MTLAELISELILLRLVYFMSFVGCFNRFLVAWKKGNIKDIEYRYDPLPFKRVGTVAHSPQCAISYLASRTFHKASTGICVFYIQVDIVGIEIFIEQRYTSLYFWKAKDLQLGDSQSFEPIWPQVASTISMLARLYAAFGVGRGMDQWQKCLSCNSSVKGPKKGKYTRRD